MDGSDGEYYPTTVIMKDDFEDIATQIEYLILKKLKNN